MSVSSSSQVRPRVIIVSSSVGAGHNQAAAAIQAGLAAADATVRTEVVDALAFVPWWHRLCYAGGYHLMVSRLPAAFGLGYRLMDRPAGAGRAWSERLRLGAERLVTRRLQEYLLGRRPVLVMATHYLAMPPIGRLIGRGVGGLGMMAVITDHEAHRFWYAENVRRYFVANERVREQLLAWGVQPERITVSGIPVHPKWTAPVRREEILRRWNLPEDRPVVVVTGGAYFTAGPVEQIARGLLERTGAHVVFLAGSNKKLLARVAGFPEAGARLTPVAWTDRVHELAAVAAVFVTKAGGLMTSECVARGTCMVLTRPVPGQEAANARFLVAHGAAVVARSAEEVVAETARLLADPAAAESLRTAARGLYRPATETIVSAILEAL